MSLTEVQEGQAQSLLPKTIIPIITTAPAPTPPKTTTTSIPSWKWNPAPAPAPTPTPTPTAPVTTVPSSVDFGIIKTTPTPVPYVPGPTPPSSIDFGLTTPTNPSVSPEYLASVQEVRNAPAGTPISSISGIIVLTPSQAITDINTQINKTQTAYAANQIFQNTLTKDVLGYTPLRQVWYNIAEQNKQQASIAGQQLTDLGLKIQTEFHPATKIEKNQLTGEYTFIFPYAGAEKYGTTRKEIEAVSPEQHLLFGLTSQNPGNIPLAFAMATGAKQTAKDIEVKSWLEMKSGYGPKGELTLEGFGASWLNSPITQIGLTAVTMGGYGYASGAAKGFLLAKGSMGALKAFSGIELGVGALMGTYAGVEIYKTYKEQGPELAAGKLWLTGTMLGAAGAGYGLGAGSGFKYGAQKGYESFLKGELKTGKITTEDYTAAFSASKAKYQIDKELLGIQRQPIKKTEPLEVITAAKQKTITIGAKFSEKYGELSYFTQNNEVVISDILAIPEKKGIGTELITALKEQYPTSNIKTLAAIESAQPFYMKLGFEETDMYGSLLLKQEPTQSFIGGQTSPNFEDIATFKDQPQFKEYFENKLPSVKHEIFGGAASNKPQGTHDLDVMLGAKETMLAKYTSEEYLGIGKAEKFVDIKPPQKPGEIVSEFGTQKLPSLKTEEGYNVMPWSEQFGRLSSSSLRPAHAGRLKDLPESIRMLEQVTAGEDLSPSIKANMEIYNKGIQGFIDKYGIEQTSKNPLIRSTVESDIIYGPSFREKFFKVKESFWEKTTPESIKKANAEKYIHGESEDIMGFDESYLPPSLSSSFSPKFLGIFFPSFSPSIQQSNSFSFFQSPSIQPESKSLSVSKEIQNSISPAISKTKSVNKSSNISSSLLEDISLSLSLEKPSTSLSIGFLSGSKSMSQSPFSDYSPSYESPSITSSSTSKSSSKSSFFPSSVFPPPAVPPLGVLGLGEGTNEMYGWMRKINRERKWKYGDPFEALKEIKL